MKATKATKAEQLAAAEALRADLPPGATVYCVLRSVSRSGMSRVISLHFVGPEGEMRWISYLAAKALGMSFDRNREGIKIGGCGMDMGFALVSDLAATLYPDGFGCTGEKCPSNDHSNGDCDRTPHGNGMTPHRREVTIGADHWHRSGCYALRYRWI